MSWWILYLLLPAVAADLVRMGCDRDPSLPFCKAEAAKTRHGEDGEEITDKDKVIFAYTPSKKSPFSLINACW